ncbi:MAG TPA: response regulator [Holophagaceae bacterium]|nr:response regulator [Holophagaceae bacterium]
MPSLLLVEDNDLNRDALSRLLARRGYLVVQAKDGAEALHLASSQRFDLILMDVGLPVMDGHEVTRRLRERKELAGVPILALTAHAMDADREAALAAGCDDFATKPVAFAQLLLKIEALLDRAGKGGTDAP